MTANEAAIRRSINNQLLSSTSRNNPSTKFIFMSQKEKIDILLRSCTNKLIERLVTEVQGQKMIRIICLI